MVDSGWEEIAQSIQDKAMVLAIEVAKVEQYGVLMDSERQAVVTVKWEHPAQTPERLKRVSALPCRSLTAVMESTGVYGDTLRGQLRQAGVEIHQVSPKRVHDACEGYDGVPSLHEACPEVTKGQGGAGDCAAVLGRGQSGLGRSQRVPAGARCHGAPVPAVPEAVPATAESAGSGAHAALARGL